MFGFDKDFWYGVPVLVTWFILSYLIAKIFHLDPIWVLLGLGALLWLVLDVLVKKLMLKSSDDNAVIYCEWEDRINEFDFDAHQKSTISCFEELGLSLEQSVGRTFTFHTEPSLKTADIYFQGQIVRDGNGRILIRAFHPVNE